MTATAIPSNADLATLSRTELQALCQSHHVTVLQGDGPSMMRRALAARRDGQRMPGRVEPIASAPPAAPNKPAPATEKPHAPAASQGTVTSPIQGPDGTPQVFVHQQTPAGLVYAVANGLQALAWAFATVRTVGEMEALAKAAEQLADATHRRIAKPAGKAQPVKHDCPAPCTELPAPPVSKPEQLVTLPATSNPSPAPAPKKSVTPPASYKALMAMGKDGVTQLARQHGIDTTQPWSQLVKAVWGKVKGGDAPKGEEKKADTPKVAAQNAKSDAAAPFVKGTLLVADGKGGVTVASKADILAGLTEADLWAALERLAKRVA